MVDDSHLFVSSFLRDILSILWWSHLKFSSSAPENEAITLKPVVYEDIQKILEPYDEVFIYFSRCKASWVLM